jgi:hypothetical protein
VYADILREWCLCVCWLYFLSISRSSSFSFISPRLDSAGHKAYRRAELCRGAQVLGRRPQAVLRLASVGHKARRRAALRRGAQVLGRRPRVVLRLASAGHTARRRAVLYRGAQERNRALLVGAACTWARSSAVIRVHVGKIKCGDPQARG